MEDALLALDMDDLEAQRSPTVCLVNGWRCRDLRHPRVAGIAHLRGIGKVGIGVWSS
jgi:hypothetical protein